MSSSRSETTGKSDARETVVAREVAQVLRLATLVEVEHATVLGLSDFPCCHMLDVMA